jgi:outer membrane receptor protein involved in Fe transport
MYFSAMYNERKNNTNSNSKYFFDATSNSYLLSLLANSQYAFQDAVSAGYITFSDKIGKKISCQLGLRGESSNYNGSLAASDSSFVTKYLLSLFPSTFLTYKISEWQEIQLNYFRRITRPSFFQLLPYTDYSDPQNLVVGNLGLKPSFTNSFELSYSTIFNNKNSFLASAYFKNSTDLITSYQYKDINHIINDSAFFSSYTNANNSIAYGLELTSKNAVTNWWEVMININLFNTKINDNNIQSGLSSQMVSWFGKLNNTIRLPANFTIQISADYQTKSVLLKGTGNNGGRGGYGSNGGFGGSTILSTDAEDYANPNYGVDIAIKKDFLIAISTP